MRKKKILLTAGLGLLSCTLLTSCDYSNFSLFGLFYNIWLNNYENALTGGKTSSSSGEQNNNFVPQTYRVTQTYDVSGGQVKKTQLLNLITADYATLTSYERLIPAAGESQSKTYKSFNVVGNYTRSGNVVTMDTSKGVNVYVDRSSGQAVYHCGNSESVRKENWTTVFGSDSGKLALASDGTFTIGESADSGSEFTGLSACNTYFLMDRDEGSRPMDQVINLFDDNSYAITSFALDSKNHEQPVSSFTAFGTYKTFKEQSTEIYDVIQFKRDGRGYMYASNNGSDMEFDLNSNTNFLQWYAMTIGKYRSLKITKVGYTDEVTFDDINPYGFQVMDSEVEQDEEPVVKETLIELKGKENESYKLSIYKDNTYKFEGAASEEGTWAYDKENDILTLTCGEKKNTFAISEDGNTYDINYVSNKSDQLHQKFSMTKEEWESLFRILLELKGSTNENIALTLYNNGTYHFEYKGMPAKEDGAWVYNKNSDTLELTIGETKISSTKNANGTYSIHYVFSKNSQLFQDYTISKETWDATFQRVIATMKGTALSTTTLSIYSNGTYHFDFAREENNTLAKEDGKWSIDEKGTVSLTNDGKTVSKFVKQADGSYLINFVLAKSSACSQDFILDSYNFNVLTKKSLLTVKGNENEAVSISFYADNTYSFDFTLHGHIGKETGIYSYDSENDKVTLTCGDKVNTLAKQDDGSYALNYVAKMNESLKQSFTLYAQSMRNTFPHADVKLSNESSRVKPYFNLHSDGTYEFGFAAYNKSEKGTWTYDETNDKFDFLCCGKKNSFTLNEDGTAYTGKYVSNMSDAMNQTFTLNLADAKQIRRKTLVEIVNSNTTGTKFTFSFYENHTYKFSFVNYGVTEYGVWSYDASKDVFTFVCNNTKNEATKQDDGSYLIHYISDRSSQMKQDYVLSAADAAKLIA